MAKAGRKSKYETHILPNLEKIKELASTCTESDIAKQMGVSLSSFMTWKKEHPELQKAIKEGQQSLVVELKSKLVQKALGYDYEEWTETSSDKGISKTTYHKRAHPCTDAINLLLKNYDKEHWSDDPQKQDIREKEYNLKVKALENQMNGFI